jgi:hypothetical protein
MWYRQSRDELARNHDAGSVEKVPLLRYTPPFHIQGLNSQRSKGLRAKENSIEHYVFLTGFIGYFKIYLVYLQLSTTTLPPALLLSISV